MKPNHKTLVGSFAVLAAIVLAAVAGPALGQHRVPARQDPTCPTSTETPPPSNTTSSGIIPPLPTSGSTTPTSMPPPTQTTGNSTSTPCPGGGAGRGANRTTGSPAGEADTPGLMLPGVLGALGAGLFLARRRR